MALSGDTRETLMVETYQDPIDVAAQALQMALLDLREQLVDSNERGDIERCRQIQKIAATYHEGFERLEAYAITRIEQLQER